MPRVHFVKAARKPIPSIGVKKGDSYFWWKNRRKGSAAGFKRVSKTRPRPSQLTMSEFFSTAYQIQEVVEDMVASAANGLTAEQVADELRAQADEARQLGSDTEDKFNNMPDGLQQGDTGQLLEARAQACEEVAGELEAAADDIEALDVADKDDAEVTPEKWLADRVQDVIDGLGWNWEG